MQNNLNQQIKNKAAGSTWLFKKQQTRIPKGMWVLVGVSLKDLAKPSKINGLQAESKVLLSEKNQL